MLEDRRSISRRSMVCKWRFRRVKASMLRDIESAPSPDGYPAPPGLRERHRRELIELIHTIALSKFDEHGYDGTSMREICATAGISLRTLFRHFNSKDAIFRHGVDIREQQILARLATRPRTEFFLQSYLYAIDSLLGDIVARPSEAVREQRLVCEVPALRAQYMVASQDRATDDMDIEFARRLGCDPTDGQMRLLRCCLVNALIQATSVWLQRERQLDLRETVRDYIELFAPVAQRISSKGAARSD